MLGRRSRVGPQRWARTAGSTCLTVEGRRVRVRAGTDAARAGALVAVAEPERPDPIHAQFLARVQLPTWDATDVPWDQRRIEHAPPSSRGDWQTNRPRIGCSSAVVAPTRLGSFELLTGAALLQPACGLTNDSGHRQTDADAPPSPRGVLPSDGARTVPLNGSTVRYVRDAGRSWPAAAESPRRRPPWGALKRRNDAALKAYRSRSYASMRGPASPSVRRNPAAS